MTALAKGIIIGVAYIFRLSIVPRTLGQPTSYTLNADPQNATTGKNHFYINSTSASIHFNPNRPAIAIDPPLGD